MKYEMSWTVYFVEEGWAASSCRYHPSLERREQGA